MPLDAASERVLRNMRCGSDDFPCCRPINEAGRHHVASWRVALVLSRVLSSIRQTLVLLIICLSLLLRRGKGHTLGATRPSSAKARGTKWLKPPPCLTPQVSPLKPREMALFVI